MTKENDYINQPYKMLITGDDGQEITPVQFRWAGLTKREYFAAMALQGLCSTIGKDKAADETIMWAKPISKVAADIADALITELNKESP